MELIIYLIMLSLVIAQILLGILLVKLSKPTIKNVVDDCIAASESCKKQCCTNCRNSCSGCSHCEDGEIN